MTVLSKPVRSSPTLPQLFDPSYPPSIKKPMEKTFFKTNNFKLPRYPASVTPWTSLREVMVSKLVPGHNTGVRLIGQITLTATHAPIGEDQHFTNSSFIFQDAKEGAINVLVLLSPQLCVPIEKVFCKQHWIFLREPYVVEQGNEKKRYIVVRHCTDVKVCRGVGALYDEFRRYNKKDCRARGNKAFATGDLHTAIDWFSAGLGDFLFATTAAGTPSTEGMVPLRLNRAEVLISMGQYESAIIDCLAVLTVEPDNTIARLRATRALYSIRSYSKAATTGRSLIDRESGQRTEAADRLMLNLMARMREMSEAKYDWEALKAAALKGLGSGPPVQLQVSDHAGPVKLGPGVGTKQKRGLFATRDIDPGELLWVGKAFAMAPATEDDSWKNLLSEAVVRKLQDNCGSGSLFLDEYSGRQGHEGAVWVADELVIDTDIVDAILQNNPVFKVTRDLWENPEKVQQRTAAYAFYLTIGQISNNCNPNAIASFIGDIIVLRACKAIPKSKEITLRNPEIFDVNFHARQSNFPVKYSCSCLYCATEDIQAATKQKTRAVALTLIRGCAKTSHSDGVFDIVDLCIQDIEKTYSLPATLHPKLILAIALREQYVVIQKHTKRASWPPKRFLEEALKTHVKTAEALGFTFEKEYNEAGELVDIRIKEWGLLLDQSLMESFGMLEALAKVTQPVERPKLGMAFEVIAQAIYKVVAGEGESYEATMGRIFNHAIENAKEEVRRIDEIR